MIETQNADSTNTCPNCGADQGVIGHLGSDPLLKPWVCEPAAALDPTEAPR